MYTHASKTINLVKEFTRTDFKLRYQDSVLGYIWSILRPLFMFAILYFVFAYVFPLGRNVPNFASYLFVGIVFWQFFTEATTTSLRAIVDKSDMIRKINFPKMVIILSRLTGAGINLAINGLVVVAFMLFTGVEVNWTVVLLPLLLLEFLVLAFAVSLIISALYVRFRDLGQIWEVFLQMMFYLSAVLYPLNVILERTNGEIISKVMLLNPLTQIVQDIRYVLITKQTVVPESLYGSWAWRLIPIAVILLLLVIGIRVFKRHEPNFAEYV